MLCRRTARASWLLSFAKNFVNRFDVEWARTAALPALVFRVSRTALIRRCPALPGGGSLGAVVPEAHARILDSRETSVALFSAHGRLSVGSLASASASGAATQPGPILRLTLLLWPPLHASASSSPAAASSVQKRPEGTSTPSSRALKRDWRWTNKKEPKKRHSDLQL